MLKGANGVWQVTQPEEKGNQGVWEVFSPAPAFTPVDPSLINLSRAFPTADDRRLFPVFTGRAFPTD